GWDVDAAIRDAGVGGRVSVLADVPDDEFLAWLSAFDILVNLRYPHRGESSGSLVRALQVGTPTIVSGVGTYLEVPDDVVVRIGPGRPDPEELAGGSGLKQSSVYRNLAALEQAGVVRRLVTDEEFGRYELAEDLIGHHHHLVCSRCGKMRDVAVPEELERTLERTLDRIAKRAG